MSTRLVDYLLKHPDEMEKLPIEILQKILAVARAEQARGGSWLPQSATDAMTSVVDDRLMSDIAGDARRTNDPGFLKPERGPAVEKGSGWSNPIPLAGSVPGIHHLDKIAAHFDRMDKIDEAGRIAAAIKGKGGGDAA